MSLGCSSSRWARASSSPQTLSLVSVMVSLVQTLFKELSYLGCPLDHGLPFLGLFHRPSKPNDRGWLVFREELKADRPNIRGDGAPRLEVYNGHSKCCACL